MVKQIDYRKPFLIIVDDDDGIELTRYINVHQIIDIEVSNLVLSILSRDDIEYEYKLNDESDVHVLFQCAINCF